MLRLIKITVTDKHRAFMCSARTRPSNPNMACTHPTDIRQEIHGPAVHRPRSHKLGSGSRRVQTQTVQLRSLRSQ